MNAAVLPESAKRERSQRQPLQTSRYCTYSPVLLPDRGAFASAHWVRKGSRLRNYWANSRAGMVMSNWGNRSVYVIGSRPKLDRPTHSKVLQPHYMPGSQQGLHT
jgi:hypothetical protein